MDYKKELRNKKILVALIIIAVLVLSYLFTAGAFYLLIKILACVGITKIGELSLVFSWKLAFYFWLICSIIKSIFASPNSSK